MVAAVPSLLVLTGSMGSGKTAVLAEASDILALRGITHAAVDLDLLGMAHLPAASANDDVMYRNLETVWQNYVSLGVDRLLLARAIDNRAEFSRCIETVGATEAIVCRLTAAVTTMRQRIAGRELGVCRDKYLERVTRLNEALDRVSLETFAVNNEDRPLTEVATEVLERARWL